MSRMEGTRFDIISSFLSLYGRLPKGKDGHHRFIFLSMQRRTRLFICVSNFGNWNLRFRCNITTTKSLTQSHFPFLQIRATGPTTGTRLEGRSPGSKVIHMAHRGTVVRALLRRACSYGYCTHPSRIPDNTGDLVELSDLRPRSQR